MQLSKHPIIIIPQKKSLASIPSHSTLPNTIISKNLTSPRHATTIKCDQDHLSKASKHKLTNMSWFFGDRRGPQWKQGWRGEVMSSLSLPPPPLIAVFAIVILFLSLSWYTDYKAKMEEAEFSLRFLFLFVPVILIFMVRNMFVNGRFVVRLPRPEQEAVHRAGSSPWGVAALVVLLLVLVSYQSSFHSKWFRPLWRRSHY